MLFYKYHHICSHILLLKATSWNIYYLSQFSFSYFDIEIWAHLRFSTSFLPVYFFLNFHLPIQNYISHKSFQVRGNQLDSLMPLFPWKTIRSTHPGEMSFSLSLNWSRAEVTSWKEVKMTRTLTIAKKG